MLRVAPLEVPPSVFRNWQLADHQVVTLHLERK